MTEKKILIVDDDEELHLLYGLYLRGESFQIVKAFNGKEALEIMSREKPDLIVLDMIMPVMDGETFLNKIHEKSDLRRIPIIIASVNDHIPQKVLSLANVYTVLKKPFSVEDLIGKIRKAISESAS